MDIPRMAQRPHPKDRITYKKAGVDIDEADRAVSLIRKIARKTFTSSVLTDIGSFGGGFLLKGYREPVLVSSADGVGTKIKLAFLTGRHSTIGEDLVNHCVNDIAVQGAIPLFFLDYFSVGKLDARVAAEVVSGVARGCRANGCALIGGETAEMPGLYTAGEYDLAGFIVGVVERKHLLTGAGIKAGDALIGLPSTGLHTNGYSLARKLLFEVARYEPETYVNEIKGKVGNELMQTHRSYWPIVKKLIAAECVSAMAHITGGGITENLPRVLPRGISAVIEFGSWPVLSIFTHMQKVGNVPHDDMMRTFNMGIGMLVVVPAKKFNKAESVLGRAAEKYYRVGRIMKGERKVSYS